MLERHRLAWLLIAGGAAITCMSAIAGALTPGPSSAVAATANGFYRTQLFNLLGKDDNAVDGKNDYQESFAKQFDALLASSSLAKADKTPVALKKRLLSGPAPTPALRTDPATGRQWIVYDACQAHRCDEISLRLLYDPDSRRMVAKLKLGKESEFLGAPTAAEQRLLGSTQAGAEYRQGAAAPADAPFDKMMAALIDYKAFRLSSDGFDRLVSPYCKRTDRQKDEHGVDAEYRCDAGTGITEMKISTREGGARNYVMYIQLFLAADRYAPLKSQMQSRLGKPGRSGKDYVRYVYAGDKELGKMGTPVISLSREDAQTVAFSIALEQGP